MPETHEFEGDLRNLIQRRQVVAVVGSGVSMATNPQEPTWRGHVVVRSPDRPTVPTAGLPPTLTVDLN